MSTRTDQIKRIGDPVVRLREVTNYVTQHSYAAELGIAIRNDTIKELIEHYGVTATAKMANLSVSQIKTIRKNPPVELVEF